jgi:hypothetical protein
MAKDTWRCRLSASPKRVRDSDTVTLTVTLSYGNYELQGTSTDQTTELGKFTYAYASDVDQLDTYLKNAANNLTHAPTESFTLTGVPDGACEIRVTATPNKPGTSITLANGNTVLLPKNPLGAQDSISVITHRIETDIPQIAAGVARY